MSSTYNFNPQMITLNDQNCYVSSISSEHRAHSHEMTTHVELVLYGNEQHDIFNQITSGPLNLKFNDSENELEYLHKYLEYRGLSIEYDEFKKDLKGIERI